MVLVTILNFEYSHKEVYDDLYVFELDVRGYKPESSREVIDFITKWAKTLEFNYIENEKASEVFLLRRLGYILNELTRNKIYIGDVPKNTYEFESGKQIACDETNCLSMFVDQGSPVRHVYFVTRNNGPFSYRIFGHGIYVCERIDISVAFSETIHSNFGGHVLVPKYSNIIRFLFDHGKVFQKYRKLIEDSRIHTVLHPNLEENIATCFKAILRIVEKEEKKQQRRKTKKH